MSGSRTWWLAIAIPVALLRYALLSSHDDYDYKPPSYYVPPSFNYTPPPLPTTPDPTDDPPAKLIDALQIEDGDAPDLASAKADMEPPLLGLRNIAGFPRAKTSGNRLNSLNS